MLPTTLTWFSSVHCSEFCLNLMSFYISFSVNNAVDGFYFVTGSSYVFIVEGRDRVETVVFSTLFME